MQKIRDQEQESAIFCATNAARINQVSEKLLLALPVVTLPCAEYAKSDLALADVLKQVQEAKETKDIRRLFSVLRYHAAKFSGIPELSPIYWEWIDACDQLADSRSVRWPYLTQEGRARYLDWSEEGVDKLLSLTR
jgi:hypothetical protein